MADQKLADTKCGCAITVHSDVYVGEALLKYCPLHAHAKEMKEMLKELEWASTIFLYGRLMSCCPSCDEETSTHKKDCDLQALLKEIDNG